MDVTVEVVGLTPLLQHRFSENAEAASGKATRGMLAQQRLPRDVAEEAAYRFPKTGELYIPGASFARLIREAGSNHKMKGSRKSVKYLIPAAVLVMADAVALLDPKTGEPLKDFEVDSRPVVIPATKGRVMRHRPRLDAWMVRFDVLVREDVLPAEVIHELLVEGGQRYGVGDFRPEKGGPFGTFRVTKWEEKKAEKGKKAA